ncbi:MAG TPA: hypothetical protein VF960_15205 [Chloroflexota bacterium]
MQAIELVGAVAAPHARSTRLPASQLALGWVGTWQATLLMGVIGAALGGYLGVICVAYAWGFGRRVVLDQAASARRRAWIASLAVGSAVVLYDTLLTGFRLLMSM